MTIWSSAFGIRRSGGSEGAADTEERMFEKILVANRGEIAIRIMRTARGLGIGTVAVHSEADAQAPHVRYADESVLIGPPPAAQSYLRIDAILDAARASGADAVHPGYGFLSENAGFAEALEAAGIVFIGPPAPAISAMGDKVESKRIATAAGVSTIPGHAEVIGSAEEAIDIAKGIGFPVMIKAAAGGGGKGMRVAHEEAGVREGFVRSSSEALSSFGDDRVFIEKFIVDPRHIEIQVLADAHGNAIHLGERECSIQRRNQKVIEESPSPFLDAAGRERMGAQAVALALAVQYRSAGTVEFVVDAARNFYFLEMNTRLQVEHPVTELVTGVDLVEQMLRIAAGEKLAFSQEDIIQEGWALESRIYAEDPFRGFLPSTGRLTRFEPPAEEGGVRVDSGVAEGSEISVHYDPMIAKLCAFGADRIEALEVMRGALDRFGIAGVEHNIPFVSAVMDDPDFIAGNMHTGFIDAAYPDGFSGVELPDAELARLAAVCLLLRWRSERRAGAGAEPPPFWVASSGSRTWEFCAVEAGSGLRMELVDGGSERMTVEAEWTPGTQRCVARVDGVQLVFQIERRGEAFTVSRRGARVSFLLRTRANAALARWMPRDSGEDSASALVCPMPGLVVSIDVEEGQEVEAGEPLATIEAMKMENVLRADRKATVAHILVSPGDVLAVDDVILEFT